MKPVVKEMIKNYHIKHVDFMGYKKDKHDYFSFHHLIVPARNGGKYIDWNGAVLCAHTSHPYLHVIENFDNDLFVYITHLILDEKALGRLDLKTLKKIDMVLKGFEQEYQGKCYGSKKKIIKPEYTKRDYSSVK